MSYDYHEQPQADALTRAWERTAKESAVEFRYEIAGEYEASRLIAVVQNGLRAKERAFRIIAAIARRCEYEMEKIVAKTWRDGASGETEAFCDEARGLAQEIDRALEPFRKAAFDEAERLDNKAKELSEVSIP